MIRELSDQRIKRVLSLDGTDTVWRANLQRLIRGDASLTRASAGEETIAALQRLLIFLGYSTASSGGFVIDGDFGRGTNRGIAQFQFEHGLAQGITRKALCYPCTFRSARKNIVAIADVKVDVATLTAMVREALSAIDSSEVTCGDFEEALFHLNNLHLGRLLNCGKILARYGAAVNRAVARLQDEKGIDIRPEWILSIIRQETAGIVRPRFEQHKLTAANAKHPRENIAELRLRSMSIGLGQIMGFNYARVGAPSARAMLFSPLDEQVLFIARFMAPKRRVLSVPAPGEAEFRAIARFYNGPAYEKHFYHERLQTWFREFRAMT